MRLSPCACVAVAGTAKAIACRRVWPQTGWEKPGNKLRGRDKQGQTCVHNNVLFSSLHERHKLTNKRQNIYTHTHAHVWVGVSIRSSPALPPPPTPEKWLLLTSPVLQKSPLTCFLANNNNSNDKKKSSKTNPKADTQGQRCCRIYPSLFGDSSAATP